jgi:hypothetical protein
MVQRLFTERFSRARSGASVLLLVCLGGCSGSIGESDGLPMAPGGTVNPGTTPGSTVVPGSTVPGSTPPGTSPGSTPSVSASIPVEDRIVAQPLRRLTKAEMVNTLADIFGAAALEDPTVKPALMEVPDDPVSKIIETVSDLGRPFAEAHRKLSLQLGAKVAATPALVSRFASQCQVTAADSPCFRTFVQNLGLQLLRRPLTAAEVDIYMARVSGQATADALKFVTMNLLRTTEFLFHIELGNDTGATSVFRLTPYEIAARLSYRTIGSLPDAALLDAASQGNLGTVAQLRAQSRRLLGTPAARAYLRGFVNEWLGLLPTSDPEAGVALRAGITATGFAAEALEEVHRFVEQSVWTEHGNLKKLLTSTASFPYTDNLARVLGVPRNVTGPVSLTSGQAGLILRPAILASTQEETSPISRGVFVLRHLLCTEIQDPPANLDIDAEVMSKNADPRTMSNRVRTDLITSSAACSGCHSVINPIGYSLEAFGLLGSPRTVETVHDAAGKVLAQHPIDTNVPAALIGGETRALKGAQDLIDAVSNSDAAGGCLARYHFEYTRFRKVKPTDDLWLRNFSASIRAGSVLDAFADGLAQEDMFFSKTGT